MFYKYLNYWTDESEPEETQQLFKNIFLNLMK